MESLADPSMPLIMLLAVKSAPAAAALAVTLAMFGCGGRNDEAATIDPRESVAAAVDELADAFRARDYRRVCERIFSAEGRRRAGGEECQRRLARTSRGVRDPRLELVSVDFEERGATAHVRASADGERPAIDVVRLVPSAGGYRVESLSGQ
jgi:hypothetical protein